MDGIVYKSDSSLGKVYYDNVKSLNNDYIKLIE